MRNHHTNRVLSNAGGGDDYFFNSVFYSPTNVLIDRTWTPTAEWPLGYWTPEINTPNSPTNHWSYGTLNAWVSGTNSSGVYRYVDTRGYWYISSGRGGLSYDTGGGIVNDFAIEVLQASFTASNYGGISIFGATTTDNPQFGICARKDFIGVAENGSLSYISNASGVKSANLFNSLPVRLRMEVRISLGEIEFFVDDTSLGTRTGKTFLTANPIWRTSIYESSSHRQQYIRAWYL